MTNLDVQALLTQMSGLITEYGLKVIGAILVLIIGRAVAGWARKATRRAMERGKIDPTLIPFLSGMVYTLAMVFVVVAVLGLFGIPTASFIAVLGAAGLAVGLAMQGTLSNFAAGVMLLVFRPFKVGDFVEVAGTLGKVEEIGIFATQLNTPDNIRVIISNGTVYGDKISNYTANDIRRVDLTVGVGYGDDLELAKKTILSVVTSHEKVLQDPAPQVEVVEMADSSVNFVVRPWAATADYWRVYFDVTQGCKEQLEAAGCSIPFPQRDVHLFPEEGSAA
ncbi:MAG: mechanosensitive ion channel [Gemmatimonadota bacterium]